MTKEEAFEVFCDEAEVTDPIIRELRVKPIFMSAWRMAEENTRLIDIDKACQWWKEYLDYPTYIDEDRERIQEMIDDFKNAMNEGL